MKVDITTHFNYDPGSLLSLKFCSGLQVFPSSSFKKTWIRVWSDMKHLTQNPLSFEHVSRSSPSCNFYLCMLFAKCIIDGVEDNNAKTSIEKAVTWKMKWIVKRCYLVIYLDLVIVSITFFSIWCKWICHKELCATWHHIIYHECHFHFSNRLA